MSKSLRQNEHITEATLWQWREQELAAQERLAIKQHLQSCAACQKRAQSLNTFVHDLRTAHHALQPSFAQQVHLLAALQSEFVPRQKVHTLAETCQTLVRWLAPALAILAAVFVLWREETTATSNSSLEGLLSQSREEQLLIASDEETAQQMLLELAFAPEGK